MADRWDKVFSKKFSANDGENAVLAMAELNRDLYIGTGLYNPSTSGNVYRHSDIFTAWEKVTPPWPKRSGLYSCASGVASNAMIIFNNDLYVGIDHNEYRTTSDGEIRVINEHSQVWRTSDGNNWSKCDLLRDSNGRIGAMAEFDKHLYVAYQGRVGEDPYFYSQPQIWRTSDGRIWNQVQLDSDVFSKGNIPGHYDWGIAINALEEFDGYLYVGCSLDNKLVNNKPDKTKGIRLIRTNNVTDWYIFQDVLLSTADPTGATKIHALKAFKNNLYVGGYPGKVVWRTDGTVKADGKAAVWQAIPAIKSGNIFRMEEYHQKLYLGVSHRGTKDALIYYSENGQQWKPVEGGPNENPENGKATFLFNSGADFFKPSKLYFGTKTKHFLKDKYLEVWELGPEIQPDNDEPNNKLATAKFLELTDTQPIRKYLTLHKNDVDFFKIEFKIASAGAKHNSPLQKRECWSLLKNKASAPGGGGIFYIEHNQEFLSIHARETYDRPLHLEIYSTEDKKEPDIKNYDENNNITSDEIRINCPSQIFPNNKFFLAIKPPEEPKSCDYYLYAQFSRKSASIKGKILYDYRESLPAPYPPPPFRKLIDPTTKYDDIDKFLTDSEKYLSEFIDYSSQIEQANLRHKLGYTSYLADYYDRAEKFYNQSLSTYKELEIPTKVADVLRSLGELNSAQGETTEAVKNFEDAAQIHQQLEDEEGLAYDRMALGNHYLQTGEYYESLVALEKALALQVRLPDMSGELLNFLDQSEAFLKLDQKEAAVACHILGEELSSRIEDAAMSQEVDQRREMIVAQIGEQEFLELEERLADRAATVRYEAISEILEGQDLD